MVDAFECYPAPPPSIAKPAEWRSIRFQCGEQDNVYHFILEFKYHIRGVVLSILRIHISSEVAKSFRDHLFITLLYEA